MKNIQQLKKIKTSYLKLKANKEKQEDCKDIIMSYSGPKHNFYTDKENIKNTLVKDVFVDYSRRQIHRPCYH